MKHANLWSHAFIVRLVRCPPGWDWEASCEGLLARVKAKLATCQSTEEAEFYHLFAASLEAALCGRGLLDREAMAEARSLEERAHEAMIQDLLEGGYLDG